jgi:hypothetical protein
VVFGRTFLSAGTRPSSKPGSCLGAIAVMGGGGVVNKETLLGLGRNALTQTHDTPGDIGFFCLTMSYERRKGHSRWCTKSVSWLLTTVPKNILYTQTSRLQYHVPVISTHISYIFEGRRVAVLGCSLQQTSME